MIGVGGTDRLTAFKSGAHERVCTGTLGKAPPEGGGGAGLVTTTTGVAVGFGALPPVRGAEFDFRLCVAR